MNWPLFIAEVPGPPLPPVPVNPSAGGGNWGWIAALAHEMGPMGFFALVGFLAILYWLWRERGKADALQRRFGMYTELWKQSSLIWGKLAKHHKVDVSEETDRIKELIDVATYMQENDNDERPRRPWWKRVLKP